MRQTGRGLIALFARHRTAANLLMVLMIAAGLIAAGRLNTQFFPDFGIDVITISVAWPGASADDVENTILQALEPEVRFIDDVKRVRGSAREGAGSLAIEFHPGADMQAGLSAVESAVAQVTTLPEDAEEPIVSRIVRYDTISRLLISGPYSELALKHIAKRVREDLLARGIDKVTLFGARDEELWVEVAPETLLRLDLTLADIAARIRETSLDMPAGDTRGAGALQIRSLGLRRDARTLRTVEVLARDSGEKILLGDIATITDTFDDDGANGRYQGQTAIQLHVQRAVGADALQLAEVVNDYLEILRPTLPASLNIVQFDVAASLVRDRINLLLRNGAGGLVLVLAVLFLFLSSRVALWVAVGIPTAVMASLAVMLATGQSINMVSLFALIMMLGIIVDDAIVVGEHAMARRHAGMDAQDAVETGARRMVPPVFSATLTTIAAFLPIVMVTGIIGEILFAIPSVVVAVLIASLVECFLVLPGHLRHAMTADPSAVSRFRHRFNERFDRFRDTRFRRLTVLAVRWRYTVLALAFGSLIAAVGLLVGGRVQFVFFPSPESDVILANFAFSPGTPRTRTAAMLDELERALAEVDRQLAGENDSAVKVTFGTLGETIISDVAGGARGEHVGGLFVELQPSEQRSVRTQALVTAWRAAIRPLAGIDEMSIREPQGGPPGRDLDVRLSGADAATLKKAALDLRTTLGRFPGISDDADNLPWGKPELILNVSPRGRALGFTTDAVGRQVRDAFEGAIAHRFARDDEEVTVRVRLPEGTLTESRLRSLYLRSPGGAEVPLSEVVTLSSDRGFSVIQREDGVREVSVTAEVDEAVANPTELVATLAAGPIVELRQTYGVQARFAGKAEEQGETLADMRLGTMAGLTTIYIILAWVFASYTRPVVVMSIIPLAAVGAIVGHWLTGYDLTLLSLIGLLGLSGIVVNDSIILVSTIDERLKGGQPPAAAIVHGTRDRLRAVILTSLTTIGGLLPLMFETSLQAQFLKPMALTLVFGLITTTLLVLFVIPAMMAIQNDVGRWRPRPRSGAPEPWHKQDHYREQLEAAE